MKKDSGFNVIYSVCLFIFLWLALCGTGECEDGLFVNDNGNTGIGLTNPLSALHVYRAYNSSGSQTSNSATIMIDGNTGQDSWLGWATNGFTKFIAGIDDGNDRLDFWSNNGTWNNVLSIISNSCVGVGTRTPDTNFRFNVFNGGVANGHTALFSSNHHVTYIGIANIGAPNNWYLYSDRAGTFGIHQPSVADRLTILNNGNIGVNTRDPIYTLDVNGSIHARSHIFDSSEGFDGNALANIRKIKLHSGTKDKSGFGKVDHDTLPEGVKVMVKEKWLKKIEDSSENRIDDGIKQIQDEIISSYEAKKEKVVDLEKLVNEQISKNYVVLEKEVPKRNLSRMIHVLTKAVTELDDKVESVKSTSLSKQDQQIDKLVNKIESLENENILLKKEIMKIYAQLDALKKANSK